jgi:ABC-type iron transport system FetAB ATPase subunit
MKKLLHKIEITNFKAFREFSLKLEGRHLLLYGPNGSGKSSFYWALYTFLQSADKSPQGVISKYFQAGENECLLNTHEQTEATPRPGEIALTIREDSTSTDTTYRISEADHGTHQVPAIVKANLASDFITYRFFFGFSNFKNSERFDLWSLFETEILPFCVNPGSALTPIQEWRKIRGGIANPWASRGPGGSYAYSTFKDDTDRFAATLETVVGNISKKAQGFYDEHFSNDDITPIELIFGITRAPSFSGTNLQTSNFRKPILDLHLRVGDSIIKRPQSYLNEAKMTQVALSVRLAASLVNLQENEQDYLKLLVLDDLLVSLDMDNRMKVVEILLSDTFSKYQKMILTHDRGFFEEFKRVISTSHSNWCFRSLQGNPKDGISDKLEKSSIQQAQDYISGHDLDAAAHHLRKAAEETAKRYRRVAMGEIPSPGEFHSLTEDLKSAKNHLLQQIPLSLYNQAIERIPEEHRSMLVSINDNDIDEDATHDAKAKGIIKCQRKRLKQFLSDQAWKNIEVIETIDAIIQMKDRVLNPAAHWNETPLYEAELKKALKLVGLMEIRLNKAMN